MYKVIVKFADLMDNKHIYEVGDKFPRDGMDVSKDRIEQLLSGNNKIGKQLIEAITEPKRTETKKSKTENKK